MLVLSRKTNEALIIDDKTRVTVVEIRGDKVRLGVTAPPSVPVHREEVWVDLHGKEWQFAIDTDGGPSLN